MAVVHDHDEPGLDRRNLLRGVTAAVPLALGTAALAVGQAGAGEPAQRPTSAFPGLIRRQVQPDNFEFPFPTLDSFITPTERFFVRSHFAVPNVNVQQWRLRVEGAVDKPQDLTFDELTRLGTRTVPATLECAGNSRLFLVPHVAGLPWELGGVSTAEWTGVPLATILDRAGVRKDAVEVILEGADSGEARSFPPPFQTPGRIAFARSLPMAKARRPEVVLAHRMNGAALPTAHGYPVRAVVPGWYGMASVKWLTKIIVTDRPFQGYYQTMDYAIFERRHGHPVLVAVTELQPKALIARPALNELVAAGQPYRVRGAAWTGETEITRVQISTDGGKMWADARLLDRPVAHCWRLWEYQWKAPNQPGRLTLMARATDQRGRTQPMERDPDRRNVMINHVLPVEIEVRA